MQKISTLHLLSQKRYRPSSHRAEDVITSGMIAFAKMAAEPMEARKTCINARDNVRNARCKSSFAHQPLLLTHRCPSQLIYASFSDSHEFFLVHCENIYPYFPRPRWHECCSIVLLSNITLCIDVESVLQRVMLFLPPTCTAYRTRPRTRIGYLTNTKFGKLYATAQNVLMTDECVKIGRFLFIITGTNKDYSCYERYSALSGMT